MNQFPPGPSARIAGLAKPLRSCVIAAVAVTALAFAPAASATETVNAPQPAGHVTFSLLPKAFQKNPPVHMTVITEMTVDGGKLPPPTASRPMYFLSHSVGYHDEGQGYAEKKIIAPAKLEAYLTKSLAENHFLPADAVHHASLVLIFSWGSANKLDNRTDSMMDVDPAAGSASVGTNASVDVAGDNGASSYFEEPADYMSFDYATRQNFLARAQLVGGVKFAHEIAETFKQQDYLHDGASTISGLSPIELLEDRDPLVRTLMEETMDDCYYVVVSAYDAYAMAHGQRRLLWQSKMTTNSAGISMAETLPALIKTGAPYFGQLMAHATVLQGRLDRDGRVEVGMPMVMPDEPSDTTTR